MKTLEFKNGDHLPVLGLGTWKSAKGKVKEAVYQAIKCGYRHIDGAAIYGNETEVGEGIQRAIKEGIVEREELWVTSKLWNNSHEHDQVKPALEASLRDLQLDYLDLYLIHWPVAIKRNVKFPESADDFLALEEIPLMETWRAMEELKEAGLVRHLGVSNFSKAKLHAMLAHAEHAPEMNQVESHPYLQQDELIEFCHQHDVHLTAYSPLGSMDRPDTLKQENEPVPMESKEVKRIASRHGITEAQVLLAWNLSRKVAVIPKSVHKERIEENFQAAEIQLDEADIEMINAMDKGYRFVDGTEFEFEGNPYTQNNIWDEESHRAPLEMMAEKRKMRTV